MRTLFDMAGMIIRSSIPAEDVLRLLGLAVPHIVVLTVPMSLLFGILIAIGRLSSDSEIIAMRALGISTRQIYRPVFVFSLLMFGISLYLMNFVLPKGNQRLAALTAELATSSIEKEIKPRVFYDQYEGVMIYVNEVDPKSGQWKGVFVSDTRGETPGDSSASSGDAQTDVGTLSHRGGGQRIVVAESGSLSVIKPPPSTIGHEDQIWLNLSGGQVHVWDPAKPDTYDLSTNETQRLLLPSEQSDFKVNKLARSLRELNLRELIEQERALRDNKFEEITYNTARVEIQKKLAIPFACIAFGVLGLPLGITNRRGGKSSGFSLSIAIILFYYVTLNNGEHLAVAGRIPPIVGMWSANVILLALGIVLLRRANRDAGAQQEPGRLRRAIASLAARLRRRRAGEVARVDEESPSALTRLDITFPNILDRYILREFLKILGLVLISVMALFIVVDYNEIAKEVRQNDIRIHTLLYHYRFMIFQILHWTLPISVLVSTLVTFGVLAKNNEITAIKSGGVSLYRVSVPIIAVAGLVSVLAYLLLDFVLPYSQQRVDELKRKIEGKPPITASAQQRLWFHGKGPYMINFLSYDATRNELSQVHVFEFHPTEFRLVRRVYARRAVWTGQAWAFENGFMSSFGDNNTSTYSPITKPVTLYYSETPEDFATEVKPPDQMTYAQLRRYIDALKKSGYSAEDLQVKLFAKGSWPVISLVMALIALPFAFKMGRRGTFYGIGLALVIGIVYWMVFAIFTKFGEVGNLPPLLAAWAANILFGLAAIYLFLHVET
jgi:LPS export ABC transporter permease LptG/LPS export ABC transporter permease LptF